MSTTTISTSTSQNASRKKVTTLTFRQKKERGEAITMLTAYDYPTAMAMDKAGVDSILTGMIQHHKGALAMVKDVRAAGGGKETNIGDFLNEVDNDQRMEIVRMYGLLGRPVEW